MCQKGSQVVGEPPIRSHSHGDLPTVLPDYNGRSKIMMIWLIVLCCHVINSQGPGNLRDQICQNCCRLPPVALGGGLGEQGEVERRGRWNMRMSENDL